MTTIRWKSVLVLAALLAPTPTAADITITADFMLCSAGPTDAEQAAQRPELQVARDSGLPVAQSPGPEDTIQSHAKVIDTLSRGESPADLAAKCLEMEAALREVGKRDVTVAELLGEVQFEKEMLRRPWSRPEVNTVGYAFLCGGLPGAVIGIAIGEAIRPTKCCVSLGDNIYPGIVGGGPLGFAVGCAAGSVIGLAIGASLQEAALARHHRGRVNDLVRKVNRALASAP